MKEMNTFTKLTFFMVIILVAATIGLGIATVVRYNNEKQPAEKTENSQGQVTSGNENLSSGGQETQQPQNAETQQTPEPTSTSTPTNTPTPTEVPKIKIAIDPGLQGKANREQEPIGPGSEKMTSKMIGGAKSLTNALSESELNLMMAMALKDELISKGYEVYMTREDQNVNISNAERALAASESGAAVLISLRADSYTDTSVNGIYVHVPTWSNEFLSEELQAKCAVLSSLIQEKVVEATGARSRKEQPGNEMAIINWSKIPVCVIRLGFMSNPDEDSLLQQESYRSVIAWGIANGLENYFREYPEY